MGSLNKTNGHVQLKPPDQVREGEQAERRLASVKLRCEQDISNWVEQTTVQLTEAGEQLMKEVEMTVNHLLVAVRDSESMMNKFMKRMVVTDLDLKFIPKELEVGFLMHGEHLPSSFSLDLITKISDICIGGNCRILVGGVMSTFVQNNLDLSVMSDMAETVPFQQVNSKSLDNSLQFNFVLPSAGYFTITARLYCQHITGSPLVIPVYASAQEGLARIGLGPAKNSSSQDSRVQQDCDSTTVFPEKTRLKPDRLMFKAGVADAAQLAPRVDVVRQLERGFAKTDSHGLSQKMENTASELQIRSQPVKAQPPQKQKVLTMGEPCFAKSDQDGVWYNAKVDKDCGERGVEVTFVHFNTSDFVHRKNIVWILEDVPKGEKVNFGPVDCKLFGVDDRGVARWNEDGVWYNVNVDGLVNGGYSVQFTDYGNFGFVQPEEIFHHATDIPEGEVLDENVAISLKVPNKTIIIPKVEAFCQVKQEPSKDILGSKWCVGNDCLARWAEDGVWYNAIVDTVFDSWRPIQYLVTFTDYGNTERVTDDDLAAGVDNIPVDQLDMLDENVQAARALVLQSPDLPHDEILEEKVRIPLVRTNFPVPPVPGCDHLAKGVEVLAKNYLAKGVEVLAKREDDQSWHKAVIHEVVSPDRLYIVRYEDSGQFGGATPDKILLDKENIPQGENWGQDLITVDEKKNMIETYINEDGQQKGWSVGDFCIARWSQDNVWYNAQVLNVGVGRSYLVKFVNYGNEDNVVEQDMKKTCKDIPEDSYVDENVYQEEDVPQVLSKIVVPETYEAIVSHKINTTAIAQVPRPLKPASLDQAKLLSEANDVMTKLKAEVSAALERPVQARLLADAASAAADSCKFKPGDQPPLSLKCCLCRTICRKAMRLSCSKSPVCWGCAVKEITRGHVCWQCGEKGITSDNHLMKDQVLRSLVEQFNSTGKLDPAHEQALKNGLIQSESRVEVKAEISSPEQSSSVSLISRTSPTKVMAVMPDETCVAKFSEDSLWYNGLVVEVFGDGSALVYFIDYGNSERVNREEVVRSSEFLPFGAKLDTNVQMVSPVKDYLSKPILKPSTICGKLDFLSLASRNVAGHLNLAAKQTLVIKDLHGPVGVSVLADESLVIVCRGADCVSRYSKEGVFLGIIQPGRKFTKPSDILVLTSGEVVVRDEVGIQLFGSNLHFVKILADSVIDKCFGLAEDDDGRVITINCNNVAGGAMGNLTQPGNTDVFFIDKEMNKVVKRVEMVDLIEQAVEELDSLQADMSACRFLSFQNRVLYVVDMGLDCVFVLTKDGKESEMFGSRGNKEGEFRDPAGLVVDDMGTMMVVDDMGTMMVVDSRNHRLQLIDNELAFVGLVKVDVPLARPSGIFLDRKNKDIVVSNYLGKSVSRYKLNLTE